MSIIHRRWWFRIRRARGELGRGKCCGVVVIVFAAALFAPVVWAGPQNATARALLADTSSYALHINDAGQAAGSSVVGGVEYATEWSGGNVLNRGRLGDLPGSRANFPNDMNHAG